MTRECLNSRARVRVAEKFARRRRLPLSRVAICLCCFATHNITIFSCARAHKHTPIVAAQPPKPAPYECVCVCCFMYRTPNVADGRHVIFSVDDVIRARALRAFYRPLCRRRQPFCCRRARSACACCAVLMTAESVFYCLIALVNGVRESLVGEAARRGVRFPASHTTLIRCTENVRHRVQGERAPHSKHAHTHKAFPKNMADK